MLLCVYVALTLLPFSPPPHRHKQIYPRVDRTAPAVSAAACCLWVSYVMALTLARPHNDKNIPCSLKGTHVRCAFFRCCSRVSSSPQAIYITCPLTGTVVVRPSILVHCVTRDVLLALADRTQATYPVFTKMHRVRCPHLQQAHRHEKRVHAVSPKTRCCCVPSVACCVRYV